MEIKTKMNIGFGNLWKTAMEIATGAGVELNHALAVIDKMVASGSVAQAVINGEYVYAMKARIPA